jgi:hypothetical protein
VYFRQVSASPRSSEDGALQLPVRRLVFTGGFAGAITSASAVAVFASPPSGPALRTVAETSVCSAAESFDVYHLECVPDMALAPGIPVGGSANPR